jgi:hypothetical protein
MKDLACAGLMQSLEAQLHVVPSWQKDRALSVQAPKPLETR